MYLTDLTTEDLKAIVMDQFPSMKDIFYHAPPPPASSSKAANGEGERRPSRSMLDISIDLCSRLHREIVEEKHFGRQGAPWEFNLRDILRFCHLLQRHHHDPLHAVDVLYTQRMRTHDDRKRVHLISCDILGLERTTTTTAVVVSRRAEEEEGGDDGKGGGRRRRRVENVLPQDPAEEEEAPPVVRVSPSHVQIDGVFLRRGGSRAKLSLNQGASAEWNLSPYSSLLPPYFPTFQLHPLKTIARCVDMNWPCLLVGSAESGCVPLLRTLARVCGHILHEIPITPGTDSSDLIGCFEQVNVAQETESLFSNASDLVRETLQVLVVEVFQVVVVPGKLLLDATAAIEERRRMVQKILEDWSLACCSYKMWSQQQQQQDNAARDCSTAVETIRNVVLLTQTALHTCFVGGGTQHESWPCLAVALEQTSAKLEAFCARQLRKGHPPSSGGGQFTWIDGQLVKAIERGDWVVLNNANLCSSSVLDRLNSLLEPGGQLHINECGTCNNTNSLRTLTPHEDFRIFLVMDAKFGEVSRAMRNRCVEVCVFEPRVETLRSNDTATTDTDARRGAQQVLLCTRDVSRMLSARGVQGRQIITWMRRTHETIVAIVRAKKNGNAASVPTTRHLLWWGDLLPPLLDSQHASCLLSVLKDTLCLVYSSFVDARTVESLFVEPAAGGALFHPDPVDLVMPALWPFNVWHSPSSYPLSMRQMDLELAPALSLFQRRSGSGSGVTSAVTLALLCNNNNSSSNDNGGGHDRDESVVALSGRNSSNGAFAQQLVHDVVPDIVDDFVDVTHGLAHSNTTTASSSSSSSSSSRAKTRDLLTRMFQASRENAVENNAVLSQNADVSEVHFRQNVDKLIALVCSQVLSMASHHDLVYRANRLLDLGSSCITDDQMKASLVCFGQHVYQHSLYTSYRRALSHVVLAVSSSSSSSSSSSMNGTTPIGAAFEPKLDHEPVLLKYNKPWARRLGEMVHAKVLGMHEASTGQSTNVPCLQEFWRYVQRLSEICDKLLLARFPQYVKEGVSNLFDPPSHPHTHPHAWHVLFVKPAQRAAVSAALLFTYQQVHSFSD